MPTRQIVCEMEVPSIDLNLGNPRVERSKPDVKTARYMLVKRDLR